MNIGNNDRYQRFQNRVDAAKKIVSIEIQGGKTKEFEQAKDTFRKGV